MAMVGFVSLAAQGLLFREHLRLHGGDEIGVAVFLASWLLWVAVGSWVHRRLPTPPWAFFLIAALQPITTLLAAWLAWRARAWAGLGPTEVLPPSKIIPFTLLSVAPVSLASGWLIPAGATWLGGGGREDAVGRAWAAEALGGALGGAAVTLVLVLGTTPLSLLGESRRAALPVPANATVLETLDTPYTSWTAVGLGDTVAFYGDGGLRAQTEDSGEIWTAAALLAQRPEARRAGILGAGAEAIACRLLDAGLEQVTVVVRDPAWAGLLRRHAPEALDACLEDPRLRWRHGDRPPAGARWDLAWLQHTDPSSAGATRFLSRSSLARIKEALAADGVLGLSITVTENVLEGPALAYASAVDATFTDVFSQVLAAGGERMLFLGSDGPVIPNADALAERLDAGPGPRLGIQGAGLSTMFEASRIATRRGQLDAAPSAPILAHRPATHLQHLLLEGEASGDPLTKFLVARSSLVPWLVAAMALGVLLIYGGRVRRGEDGAGAPAVLVAFGGAAAMAWQLVLLLAWQVRFGSLAAHFGVLSGVFMLGLWASASAVNRRLRRHPATPRTLVLCSLALLAAGGALAVLLQTEDASAFAGAAFVLSAASLGGAAGSVVPVAAALVGAAGEEPGRIAARLSLADHLGAVAATLAGGLALIPLLGFSLTVLLGMAVVASAGGLALWSSKAKLPGGVPGAAVVWRSRGRFALLLVAVVSLHQAASSPGQGPAATTSELDIPGGELSAWEPFGGPFPHWVRWDADGRIQRVRITSGAPRIPGYEGPVSVYLDLDSDETVLAAKMGPHRETPSYVWGIDGWVEELQGHVAQNLYLRGEGPEGAVEVDAMTGATVTCRALLASARASTAVDFERVSASRGPTAHPTAAVMDQPLEAPPPAAEDGPRLHRKDAKQTPHQRDVNRRSLDERLRHGGLSNHEASYYLKVGD